MQMHIPILSQKSPLQLLIKPWQQSQFSIYWMKIVPSSASTYTSIPMRPSMCTIPYYDEWTSSCWGGTNSLKVAAEVPLLAANGLNSLAAIDN